MFMSVQIYFVIVPVKEADIRLMECWYILKRYVLLVRGGSIYLRFVGRSECSSRTLSELAGPNGAISQLEGICSSFLQSVQIGCVPFPTCTGPGGDGRQVVNFTHSSFCCGRVRKKKTIPPLLIYFRGVVLIFN